MGDSIYCGKEVLFHMLSATQWELRRPKDNKIFEELIKDLFARHWNDPNTQINGRSGQKQDGIDIYGQPNQSDLWFGIQCKLREEGNLSRSDIEHEIRMAHSFRHKLDTFIVATTLPRDNKLQAVIEQLNELETIQNSFKVQIRFWEDICSLLDEHPDLIHKYYKRGGYPIHLPFSSAFKGEEILETSPLLVGVLVDVSRSMVELLSSLPKQSGISSTRLNDAINIIVEKAIGFCKTPEADNVLPRLALFVYGFGFTSIRRQFVGFLKRVGIGIETQLIPASPVRDVFAEIAAKESLPYTPTASELHRNWEYYRKNIEAQFLDVGSGKSILLEAFMVTRNRYQREVKRGYYKYPLLILISDGQLADGNSEDLISVAEDMKQMDIQIISCYIGLRKITEPQKLYLESDPHWPEEAKRLFDCASHLTGDSKMSTEMIQIAREKGWDVPVNSKLFIQINNSKMLEELVEIILSPIREDRSRV